jgi:hypothetical protein
MLLRLALVVAVLGIGAVLLADANAPRFISIGLGSFEMPAEGAAFRRLPNEPGCEEDPAYPEDEACARRYAFRPDASLTVWVSARNDGPFGVTL